MIGVRSRSVSSGLGLAFLCCCASSQERPPMPTGAMAMRATDVDGQLRTLGALRGKVVLVTVINTWADTAIYEVPILKRLYQSHPREDLEILCIVLDDYEQTAEIFRDAFEIPYPVALVRDRARFISDQGLLGPVAIIPTSYLISRTGELALRMEGTWSPKVLFEAIDRLVASDRRSH